MKNAEVQGEKKLELPALRQLGFVVRSIKNSIEEYSRLYGIEKWYRINYERAPITRFRGALVDTTYDIILGFGGGVQIELIEPLDAAENAYNIFLDEHGEGLQHLGYSVFNLEKYRSRAETMGIASLQEGEFIMKGNCAVKTVYLETGERGGIVTELMCCRLNGLPWPVGRKLPTRMGLLTGAVKKTGPGIGWEG